MNRTRGSTGQLAIFLFAALTFSTHVSAGGDADSAKGIVAEHCVACHEVPGYVSKSGTAKLDAPSFVTIANDPKVYDPKKIKAFLRQPHWPMQQFVLSEHDVDNLLAFIESLRSE